MLQTQRRDRLHRDAVLADEKRILVGPVERAAVLENPKPSGRRLVGDEVIEDDHAVRDVLLDAVTGQHPVASLGRDHGGDPSGLEPEEQAPELGAQGGDVLEGSEQRLDRVDDNPVRPHGVDAGPKADEQGLEVPLPGLYHLAGDEVDVIEHELLVGLELLEIKAEGGDVGNEVLPRFLEGHEHARLAELGDAADQELHRQQRLARTGRTANERRTPAR